MPHTGRDGGRLEGSTGDLRRVGVAAIPQPYRDVAIRHRELVKFAMVGGTTWVIDTAIFLGLKSSVLDAKPLTAKIIAVIVATIVSYVLNREWSFRTRGGHERPRKPASSS